MGTPIWVTILVGILGPIASVAAAFYATRESLKRLLLEGKESKNSELRDQRRRAYEEFLRAYDAFALPGEFAGLRDIDSAGELVQRLVSTLSSVDIYGSVEVSSVARYSYSLLLGYHTARLTENYSSEQLTATRSLMGELRDALVTILRSDLETHKFGLPEDSQATIGEEYADKLHSIAQSLEENPTFRNVSGANQAANDLLEVVRLKDRP